MADQQKFTVRLPDWMDEDDIEAAGDDIIQFIIDRSQQGFGIRENGRRYQFPSYTDKYAKEKGQTKVDLTLSSDMLEAIEILRVSGREVTIGFQSGTEENAKAEGNQIGSYGRAPNPKKARRFLGLNREELDAILARFKE